MLIREGNPGHSLKTENDQGKVEAHLWERNGFTGSPKTELSAKILEETV
jgi:hypothetical protein